MTAAEHSGRNLRILLVDNSRTTRAAMQWTLETEGYNVTAAASGQEAIDLIKTGAFHVAIFDLYMPLMNGAEATQLIRSLTDVKHNSIPIIALTGSTEEADKEMALKAGMTHYVVKQEAHTELLEILKNYAQNPPNLPV